jgi:hypothetical protein
MRYDQLPPDFSRRSSKLAREKNTSRAEARRRSRVQLRSEMVADDEAADDSLDESTPAAEPERKSLFKMPNIREDVRALPGIFRARPLIWLPFALVVVGFVLALVLYGLPADLQSIALLYLQFVFTPQSLLMYFLAGFLAPRASYLVGAILGAINGGLFVVAFALTSGPTDTPLPASDFALGVVQYVLMGTLLGAVAGGFAAWYRDFLRGIQDRSRQRRGTSEVDERARRREQRQEARKLAKQRPTS